MSTQPPNGHHHREELMRASQANMAVAQPAKTKSASKATNNAASKQKAQMHRRSRTGLCLFFPSCALCLSLLALLNLHRRRFPFLACRFGRLPTSFVLALQPGLQMLAITIRTQWLT
jgi:hypothetical protein